MLTVAQVRENLQQAQVFITTAEELLAEVWEQSEAKGYGNESKNATKVVLEEVAYLQRLAPCLA